MLVQDNVVSITFGNSQLQGEHSVASERLLLVKQPDAELRPTTVCSLLFFQTGQSQLPLETVGEEEEKKGQCQWQWE